MPGSKGRDSRVLAAALAVLGGFAAGCGLLGPAVPHNGALYFSHALHLNKGGARCLDCHVQVTSSRSASDNNLPREEACLACHHPEHPTAPHACSTCHVDPDRPRPLENRPRAVRFNHELHLAFASLPQLLLQSMQAGEYPVDPSRWIPLIRAEEICTACHRGMEETAFATEANLPVMWDCLVCHRTEPPEEQCRFCHVPEFSLFPEDHREERFYDEHPSRQEANPRLCRECHTPGNNTCIQCH